jgi:hypothetical protein
VRTRHPPPDPGVLALLEENARRLRAAGQSEAADKVAAAVRLARADPEQASEMVREAAALVSAADPLQGRRSRRSD